MKIINLVTETFDPHTSYGRMANELYAHLTAQGYHVNCFAAADDYLPNNHIIAAAGGILLAHPQRMAQFAARFPIGAMGRWICCTGNEMTQLPRGWTEILNQLDGVSVWSSWQAEIFRSNGVTVPLQVDNLGISPAFTAQVQPRTWSADEPLTFLAIGDRGERKASHIAMFAFVQAFGDDERYKLIIKRRARADKDDLANPNIEVISEDMTDAELAALYRRCHVMVFPACGEGFGIPPREFAATGGIALATNWSGLTDHIEQWGVPIDEYTFAPAYQLENDPMWTIGEWVNVDVNALAQQMQRLAVYFDHYAQQAVEAAAFVANQYQWSTWADGLLNLYVRACYSTPATLPHLHAMGRGAGGGV